VADCGEIRQVAGVVAPRPDADRERLKEKPAVGGGGELGVRTYEEARTSYRQWRLAIKLILCAGVTKEHAVTDHRHMIGHDSSP
jgi:hypothetical protein